jgi:predicted nucleotidyltransferase
MAHVKAHAAELIEVAASLGATNVCLCGSVARGDDTDDSDIDFYVFEFDEEAPGAGRRADEGVGAFRALLAPHKVDVRPLPGWLLDPPHEATMRRDAIELSHPIK